MANLDKTGKTNREIEKLSNLMYAVVVVLFVGFVGVFVAVTAMMNDYFANKASSYQALVDKINETDFKVQMQNIELERDLGSLNESTFYHKAP